MTRISVVVSARQVGEFRRALRTIQRIAAEDVEHTRRQRRRPAHRTASARLLAAATSLLDQLDDDLTAGDREVSGDREALRAAACDVLVVAIERLACTAHRHWTERPNVSELGRRLATVAASVALVERVEAARPPGAPSEGGT
jgi:hypothetical protein